MQLQKVVRIPSSGIRHELAIEVAEAELPGRQRRREACGELLYPLERESEMLSDLVPSGCCRPDEEPSEVEEDASDHENSLLREVIDGHLQLIILLDDLPNL